MKVLKNSVKLVEKNCICELTQVKRTCQGFFIFCVNNSRNGPSGCSLATHGSLSQSERQQVPDRYPQTD